MAIVENHTFDYSASSTISSPRDLSNNIHCSSSVDEETNGKRHSPLVRIQIVHDDTGTFITKMYAFPISFRHERRLKNRNQLGPSNLPELSGFFAYACDPVLIRVVCYTLNGYLTSRYANSIAIRLRYTRLRSDPSRILSVTCPPFSLQKRRRSPLANPITKQLVSRLAQHTAVAGPLKGCSATNSFSPEATDQTTTLASSPSHLSAQESD